MTIDEIIDMAEVRREIEAGYVTERSHPDFPELRILNYTDKCQFDRHWTPVTRETRGLIYNASDRSVVARAFPKIHNHDEPDAHGLPLDAPILGAFDKLDGSLGITYMRPDGVPAIATRGSFVSEQAVHATRLLRESPWARYVNSVEPTFTWLWEIIYPANRIVLDYGARDELVYLGAVARDTGAYFFPTGANPPLIAEAERIRAQTLREALALPPRPNAEGMVVWFNEHHAVKIKQADYVEMHRIVSNLSVKEVWRQLRAGTFDGFVVALPDEFHQWALDTAEPLLTAHAFMVGGANIWTAAVYARGFETRKEQALYVTEHVSPATRGMVFALLDGKDVTDMAWRMVEPKGTS